MLDPLALLLLIIIGKILIVAVEIVSDLSKTDGGLGKPDLGIEIVRRLGQQILPSFIGLSLEFHPFWSLIVELLSDVAA